MNFVEKEKTTQFFFAKSKGERSDWVDPNFGFGSIWVEVYNLFGLKIQTRSGCNKLEPNSQPERVNQEN